MADPFLRIKQHSNIFDRHGSRLFRAFCSRCHVVKTVFAKAEGSPKGIFQRCFFAQFRAKQIEMQSSSARRRQAHQKLRGEL